MRTDTGTPTRNEDTPHGPTDARGRVSHHTVPPSPAVPHRPRRHARHTRHARKRLRHQLPLPLPLHRLRALLMCRRRRLRRGRIGRRRLRARRRLLRRMRRTRLPLRGLRLLAPARRTPRPARAALAVLRRGLGGRLRPPGCRRVRRSRTRHGLPRLGRPAVRAPPPGKPAMSTAARRPPVRRLTTVPSRRVRRPGLGPVVPHAHAAGGRNDGHDRGNQTNRYVQGAHGQPPPTAGSRSPPAQLPAPTRRHARPTTRRHRRSHPHPGSGRTRPRLHPYPHPTQEAGPHPHPPRTREAEPHPYPSACSRSSSIPK